MLYQIPPLLENTIKLIILNETVFNKPYKYLPKKYLDLLKNTNALEFVSNVVVESDTDRVLVRRQYSFDKLEGEVFSIPKTNKIVYMIRTFSNITGDFQILNSITKYKSYTNYTEDTRDNVYRLLDETELNTSTTNLDILQKLSDLGKIDILLKTSILKSEIHILQDDYFLNLLEFLDILNVYCM